MNKKDLKNILMDKCLDENSCEKAVNEILKSNVVIPKELSAENGSKSLMIGEFFEIVYVPDEDYDETGETIEQKVPVSWTTIKEIYKKIVEFHTK